VSRLINIDSPTTQRNRLRRGIANALRNLAQRQQLDDDARDLAAFIALALRELHAGVERSAEAWERRNYYLKADRFRSEWAWCEASGGRLEATIKAGDWARLPELLAQLAPRFSDIRIARPTRAPEAWRGSYDRLMNPRPARE
jgi:hypothetical protein